MHDTPEMRDRFKRLMMAVAVEKHYQDNVDPALLRILFNGLEECAIEDLERAAADVVRRCKFFPRVHEWLEAVDRLPAPAVAALLPPSGQTVDGRPDGKPIYCTKCNDVGSIIIDKNDGRTYAASCDCRPNNPALGAGQRRRLARHTED